MRLLRDVCLSLGLLACLPAQGAQPWQLGMDGIGPLRVGMRFEEVEQLLGQRLERSEPELGPSPECDQIELPGRKRIWLMFIHDVLKRVDVAQGGSTAEGAAVGDPVARVFAVYPQVASEPDAYDQNERYLTVFSPDRERAMRFETHDGKIARVYAGATREVGFIEGCL
jgi:hypothetical protein